MLFDKLDTYTRTNQPMLYALLAPLATAVFCVSSVYTTICVLLVLFNFSILATLLSFIHLFSSPLALLFWASAVTDRLRDHANSFTMFFHYRIKNVCGIELPIMSFNIFHIAVISHHGQRDASVVSAISYGAILLVVIVFALDVHVAATKRATNKPIVKDAQSGFIIWYLSCLYAFVCILFYVFVMDSQGLGIPTMDPSIDYTAFFAVLAIETMFLIYVALKMKLFLPFTRDKLPDLANHRPFAIFFLIASFLILMHWTWIFSAFNSVSIGLIAVAFIYAGSILSVDWVVSLTDHIVMEPPQ
jgi:hypothetical protein